MKHVTFDLETLGSNPCAPIVQIAAVEFDPHGDVVGEPFNRHVALDEDFKKFVIDLPTILWWLRQSEAARTQVFQAPVQASLARTLIDFENWVKDIHPFPEPLYLWSHATFDPPVLMNACNVMGVSSSIPYKTFMDIRTLKMLAGDVTMPDRVTFGEQHEALADCKYQAYQIAAMLRKIGAKTSVPWPTWISSEGFV